MGTNHQPCVKKPQRLSRVLAPSADLSPDCVFLLLSEDVPVDSVAGSSPGLLPVGGRGRSRAAEGGRAKVRLERFSNGGEAQQMSKKGKEGASVRAAAVSSLASTARLSKWRRWCFLRKVEKDKSLAPPPRVRHAPVSTSTHLQRVGSVD